MIAAEEDRPRPFRDASRRRRGSRMSPSSRMMPASDKTAGAEISTNCSDRNSHGRCAPGGDCLAPRLTATKKTTPRRTVHSNATGREEDMEANVTTRASRSQSLRRGPRDQPLIRYGIVNPCTREPAPPYRPLLEYHCGRNGFRK